jgi:hypothetical protein
MNGGRVIIISQLGLCLCLFNQVINFEFAEPGSISAPLKRLQDELTNRRQFILYLSELQEDLWEARELIDSTTQRFESDMESLKKLVGSRQSVPKGQVFVSGHHKFDSILLVVVVETR